MAIRCSQPHGLMPGMLLRGGGVAAKLCNLVYKVAWHCTCVWDFDAWGPCGGCCWPGVALNCMAECQACSYNAVLVAQGLKILCTHVYYYFALRLFREFFLQGRIRLAALLRRGGPMVWLTLVEDRRNERSCGVGSPEQLLRGGNVRLFGGALVGSQGTSLAGFWENS